MRKFIFISLIGILIISTPVSSQFYNGLRMSFGKNRVQYDVSIWSFYRLERYDIYYHQEGQEIAKYIHLFAQNELQRIESILDYQLEKRIIFIIYNSLSDFRQSNIGLVSGNDESNIGGVTRISNNTVALYHEGDYKKLEKQISESITDVIVNEMLYGTGLAENITSSALINIPPWYSNGLKAYIANRWDPETENRVCDGILTGRYEKFNHLTGDDATYAGLSFWRYIAKTYGEGVIPNIVYLTKINKSVGSAFLYVLGASLKELSYDWQGYYLAQYADAQKKTNFPTDGKVLKKTRPRRVFKQLKINSDESYLAYVTNESGRYIIWLYDTQKRKAKKIFRKGNKLDQITDYSYPILAWHPSGKVLTFMIEDKGGIFLYFYTPQTKELIWRRFIYFDKVLEYSFAPGGMKFVMSAVRNGKTDIYLFTPASGTYEQITDDYADDRYPSFSKDEKYIAFNSNRSSDTLTAEKEPNRFENASQLFLYDYSTGNKILRRLSNKGSSNNDFLAMNLKPDVYSYLSDATGLINRYHTKFDSSISLIDTAVHYRYFTNSFPVTNYNTNILEQDLNTQIGKESEILFKNGRYHMFLHPISNDSIDRNNMPQLSSKKESGETFKRKLYTKKQQNPSEITNVDSSKLFSNEVDINNYLFEKEKKQLLAQTDTGHSDELTFPRPRFYETYFYKNYLVSQVDFTFLNNSYQAFTGGAPYYNPGLNFFFKLGTNDLLEDYKVTGGFRFGGDFESGEYIFSVENLKKRKDRQLLFHRQSFKNTSTSFELVKTITNELMYIERYPFSQVLSIKNTITMRHDKNVYLLDVNNVNNLAPVFAPNVDRVWAGLKSEIIFDNTKGMGLNLYSGLRCKIFGESYTRVNNFSQLFVVGADFRHYLPIHRNIIFATRLAGSSSFGSSKIIYYLGGVDNWTNIYFRREGWFDNSVPIDPKGNYAFQALATNMRGFIQNIRNGNNFMVLNAELRWPVIRYFVNHPISNNFLNNFQVIGFFDMGTAWSGISPWAGKNAYDKQVYDKNSYIVTIESNRDPIVAGYGWGVRSQLFGYFIRFDWAWGIENMTMLKPVFYLSLSLDF